MDSLLPCPCFFEVVFKGFRDATNQEGISRKRKPQRGFPFCVKWKDQFVKNTNTKEASPQKDEIKELWNLCWKHPIPYLGGSFWGPLLVLLLAMVTETTSCYQPQNNSNYTVQNYVQRRSQNSKLERLYYLKTVFINKNVHSSCISQHNMVFHMGKHA